MFRLSLSDETGRVLVSVPLKPENVSRVARFLASHMAEFSFVAALRRLVMPAGVEFNPAIKPVNRVRMPKGKK